MILCLLSNINSVRSSVGNSDHYFDYIPAGGRDILRFPYPHEWLNLKIFCCSKNVRSDFATQVDYDVFPVLLYHTEILVHLNHVGEY